MAIVTGEDFIQSVSAALQHISHAHPADFVRYMHEAYNREKNLAAKSAIEQILVNSRMSMLGKRPICQDTGVVNVFLKVGMNVTWDTTLSPQDLSNEAVARAYQHDENPLRASVVCNPIGKRANTGDNTPAFIHTEIVPGDKIEVHVAAKGGGSENKSKFAVLVPKGNIADWVVERVEEMGAGWCPPGVLGIGLGGTVERAMLLAKKALLDPLDMIELQAKGPSDPVEELRLEIFDRVNALGVGAQGLGGLTTVLDVKILTSPTHAASLPVALIPNCAANRHVSFVLDGSGPAKFPQPDIKDWPKIALAKASQNHRKVDINTLTKSDIASWKVGDQLLLTGTLLTGRDAAHHELVNLINDGTELPVNLKGKLLYYVGPVEAVDGEAVGPAGPTTATRMDPYVDTLLQATGLLGMIGKAERGPAAIASMKKHGAVSLIAVGGAAYLISQSIRSAKTIAMQHLGMEAIQEFEVVEMPVTVSVDMWGNSLHIEGPRKWRSCPVARQLEKPTEL